MRRMALLSAVFLLAATLSADPVATVDLVDNTSASGTLDLPAFVVKTPYGFLTVPTSEIIAVWPGFPATKSTFERIDSLIPRLAAPVSQTAAGNELRRIGRPAVPALQKIASDGTNRFSKQADLILKDIWPSGAHVNPNGDAVIVAKAFIVRGQLTFRTVRLSTPKGPAAYDHDQVRVIRLTPGELPQIADWPEYPLPDAIRPDLQAALADGSRLRGQLDKQALNIATPYGILAVPIREVVSIRCDEKSDELVTRSLLLRGKIETDTFNLATKIGPMALARGKFDSLTVVVGDTPPVAPVEVKPVVAPEPTPAVPAEPAPAPVEPAPAVAPAKPDSADWQKIFNGKDLKGWRKWGPGTADVAEKSIVLDGEAGLSYEGMDPISDVIISAEIKIIKPGITKLAIRESAKGLYQIEFDGTKGNISHWDSEKQKNQVLKNFTFAPTADQIYRLEFGALGPNLLAYVNGAKVADFKLPDDAVLGPGGVNVAIWHATSAFRSIEIKPLK